MDQDYRNTMILGVFAYGALGLLALAVGSACFGDKVALVLALAAFAASYASQMAAAYGLSMVNLAGLAAALTFASASLVHLVQGI